jgi:dihydroneopterin aldolase
MTPCHGYLTNLRWCSRTGIWQGNARPLFTQSTSAQVEPKLSEACNLDSPISRPIDARVTGQVLGYALRLRGIRVQSHMGVGEAERASPQELVVSVDLELPGMLYPATDDLPRAVDYAEIVRIADHGARQRPYRLLETFAHTLVHGLSERFPTAERLRVAVTKATVPVHPRTDEATVELTWGKARASS